MSDYNEAVAGLRQMRPPYRQARIKVSGYLNSDGTTGANPTDSAQIGYLWMHGYPRGANVQILIGPDINPYVPGVQLWVGDNHAGQAVAYAPVVDRNAVTQWGTGLSALTVPVNTPSLALLEGRSQASSLGGLYVHVNAFYFDDGYWPGGTWGFAGLDPTPYDFSVAAYVPLVDGYSRWVRVAFDPAALSFTAVAGEEVYTANNPWRLDEALVSAIPIAAGCYSVGAVALTYGQTTLAGARFASARLLLSPKAVSMDQIMMSADGFPMVDANGYFMLRS